MVRYCLGFAHSMDTLFIVCPLGNVTLQLIKPSVVPKITLYSLIWPRYFRDVLQFWSILWIYTVCVRRIIKMLIVVQSTVCIVSRAGRPADLAQRAACSEAARPLLAVTVTAHVSLPLLRRTPHYLFIVFISSNCSNICKHVIWAQLVK